MGSLAWAGLAGWADWLAGLTGLAGLAVLAGWLAAGRLAAQTCAFHAAFDGLQLIIQWKCAL